MSEFVNISTKRKKILNYSFYIGRFYSQLATKSKKPEQLVEYYIWASEGNFIKGDFQQGYALKRKAIALAEKVGLKFAISQSCCDMGYYCNVDARYDSARYYFRKGLEAGEDLSEAGEACRTS